MQDSQDKEASKDEVQSTREYKKKISLGTWMFVLWVAELRTEGIKIHMDKKDRTKERKKGKDV